MKPTTEAMQLFLDGQQVLSVMERNGIRIDEKYLDSVLASTRTEIIRLQDSLQQDDVYKAWRKRFGSKANLGSRQQLSTVLFDELGHKYPKELEDGEKYKADEKILNTVKIPFVTNYLQCEKLKKLEVTYLKGWQRELCNGFIHPSFNLNTVTTYRSSCNSPNTMNVLTRNPEFAEIIRRCVIPRRKGHYIVEVDFAAIEVKVAFCYHKDPVMKTYLEDKTKDMHRDMAMQIYMIDDWNSIPEKDRKVVRYNGKNGFVFPQFYGSVFFQCAEPLWEEAHKLVGPNGIPMIKHLRNKGIKELGETKGLTRGEGDRGRIATKKGTFVDHVRNVQEDFWDNRFRKYNQWKNEWYYAYRETGGFSSLTGFRWDGLFSRNDVINYPVQGAAFHCLLWCLIRVQKWLNKNRMRSKIINEIHDSMVLDVPEDELQDVLNAVHHIMTVSLPKAWDWIITPLEVEIECSDTNWFEKKLWIEKNGTWGPKA